jgi:HK97 family phage major capsid protein
MDNQTLIQKTDMALSDLKAPGAGGYMDPQRAMKFVEMMQESPTIIRDARLETFPGDSMKIDKIGFGSRILRKATENTALASNQRAKPTTGQLQLTTKETIAEVRLSYDTLEANIERENFKDHIIRMIAERAAVDLEELILNGDSASGDDYLTIVDGLIKRAQGSHVIDWKANEIDAKLWANGYNAIPEKYYRDFAGYKFYTDRVTELGWRLKVAERATATGDKYLLENVPSQALGIPVIKCSMMPHDLSYDADGAGGNPAVNNLGQLVLVHPKNMILGVSRKIQIETDKDISARQYIIVLTMKLDFTIEEPDAMSYIKNIKPENITIA